MATKDVREPALHDNLHKNQYAKVVLLNGYYILMFTLFACDALQFIFVVIVLQSVFFNFYKNKWAPYPTPLKSFYLKKKVIMCASLRAGVQ